MSLQSQEFLCWFILITSFGQINSVSFSVVDHLKKSLQLDTSKIRKYLTTQLENVISNVTQEMVEEFQETVDTCVKDELAKVYIKLDDINAKLTGDKKEVPKECSDLQILHNGVYTIYPEDKRHKVQAYCVIEDGKKWTVIQRRDNKAFDFYKTWYEYKVGFGSPNGDYWLGNENIHLISSNGNHQIRIRLLNLHGKIANADYSTFRVGGEASKYILSITGYSGGTAGDAMDRVANNGIANGQRFSTKDQDNDAGSRDCANLVQGGWWYSDCEFAGLNNRFDGHDDPRWAFTFGGVEKSLMMIAKIG